MPYPTGIITVGRVIRGVRYVHPAFSERWHPPDVIIEAIDRHHRSLVDRAMEATPGLIETVEVVSLSTYDFDTGHTLQKHRSIDKLAGLTNRGAKPPITLVPWAHQHDPLPLQSAWTEGELLFLRGGVADWSGMDSFTIHYAPMTIPVLAVEGDFLVWDSMLDAMVFSVGLDMAIRSLGFADAPPVDPVWITAERDQRVEEFMAQITRNKRATISRTREVW